MEYATGNILSLNSKECCEEFNKIIEEYEYSGKSDIGDVSFKLSNTDKIIELYKDKRLDHITDYIFESPMKIIRYDTEIHSRTYKKDVSYHNSIGTILILPSCNKNSTYKEIELTIGSDIVKMDEFSQCTYFIIPYKTRYTIKSISSERKYILKGKLIIYDRDYVFNLFKTDEFLEPASINYNEKFSLIKKLQNKINLINKNLHPKVIEVINKIEENSFDYIFVIFESYADTPSELELIDKFIYNRLIEVYPGSIYKNILNVKIYNIDIDYLTFGKYTTIDSIALDNDTTQYIGNVFVSKVHENSGENISVIEGDDEIIYTNNISVLCINKEKQQTNIQTMKDLTIHELKLLNRDKNR